MALPAAGSKPGSWYVEHWNEFSAAEKTEIRARIINAQRAGTLPNGSLSMFNDAVTEVEKQNGKDEAAQAQENASITSLGGAGLGTVGTIGGMYTAAQLAKPAADVATTATTAAPAATQGGGALANAMGANPQAPAAATSVTPSAAPAMEAIGQNADGSLIMMPASPAATSSLAPVGSDAAALGSSIGSGLESVGVGAETAGSIGSGLGVAIPVAGGMYGAYNMYNQMSDDGSRTGVGRQALTGASSGAAIGGAIGSFIPVVGTGVGAAVGGVIGGTAGAIHGLTASGKGPEQIKRDQFRSGLQESGLLDENYGLTLADGSQYDMGKDGGFMLENANGDQRHTYDVDWSDPNAGEDVGFYNALTSVLGATDQKQRSDLAGSFWNAANSSGDRVQNRRALGDRFGGRDQITQSIITNFDKGGLTPEERDAQLAAVDKEYGIQNPANKKDAKKDSAKGLLGLGKK